MNRRNWSTLIGLLASSALTAQEPQQGTQHTVITSSSSELASVHAYLDPNTGELTSQPPHTQLRTLKAVTADAKTSKNRPPIKITTHPNGMVQADLNGWFQSPITAQIDCAGNIQTNHSNDSSIETSERKLDCGNE